MSKYRGIQREYKDRLFKFLFGSPVRTQALFRAMRRIPGSSARALAVASDKPSGG